MKKDLHTKTLLDLTINVLCGVVAILLIILYLQIMPTKPTSNKEDFKIKSLEQVKVVQAKRKLRLL